MRSVDHETINACLDELIGTLAVIASRADCRRNSQTPEIIFRCRSDT